MIRQLIPPIFFVICTFTNILWDPPIKAPQTLHAKKKKPSKQYKIHVIYPYNKLIHNDPIACARYYIIKGFVYAHYSTKGRYLFGQAYNFFCHIISKSWQQHDHSLLWTKNRLVYGINISENFENFVDKYISFDILVLPITLQNAQHQHIRTCKKKIMLFLYSIIHYLP